MIKLDQTINLTALLVRAVVVQRLQNNLLSLSK